MVWLEKAHLWLGWLRFAFLYTLEYPYTQLTSSHIIHHHFQPSSSCLSSILFSIYSSLSLSLSRFFLLVFLKHCGSGLMDASLAKEENHNLVILRKNREKNTTHLNVPVELDLSLTHVHAHTLTQNRPRMAWECFPAATLVAGGNQ